MVDVFRIQDKDGRGPFRLGFSHVWVEDREDLGNLLPWFVEFGWVDRLLLYGEYGGSGCVALDQLGRWFTVSEYRTLVLFGYRSVKMEVGRLLAESKIQCFFGRAIPLSEEVVVVKLY